MKHFFASIAMFCLITMQAKSQVPDFSKVNNLYPGDSLNITYLIQHGTKIKKGKAICWFPTDSMPVERMNAITDTINTGIILAEKFIHAPLDWQAHSFNDPYTFYFRFDTIISHASTAGFVSVSFWRIKTGKAPWLHEAMHEMLYSQKENLLAKTISEEEQMKNTPVWLHEGLADYIAIEVSIANHLNWFDIFSRSSAANVDSLFKENLKSDKASYILSHIGARGIMPELFSKDRSNYAPCFYHGSASFTKYISHRYGLKALLDAVEAFGAETETIEKSTGKTIEVLKKEWLKELDIKQ